MEIIKHKKVNSIIFDGRIEMVTQRIYKHFIETNQIFISYLLEINKSHYIESLIKLKINEQEKALSIICYILQQAFVKKARNSLLQTATRSSSEREPSSKGTKPWPEESMKQ